MRRLTILNIAFPFALISADPVGGAEQILAHLDQALVTAGHRSVVIAASGSQVAGELIEVAQPTHGIGPSEWAEAHVFLRRLIPQVIEAAGADLVHMHGVDFSFYLPPPGVPVLATLHMPFSFYDERALRPAREATWLNCVSRSQYQGAPPNTRIVAAIENGVLTTSGRSSPRRRSFALAMGRICPEKGFHLALDASKRAGIGLLLAGQLYPYSEHQRYFQEEISPRLDRQRRWIGPVSGLRKWSLLGAARCLLAPSLVKETAALVAREALAAGTPVVAFPNGDLADMLETGRTGYLVADVAEMAQAIEACADINPEDCRAVARERFSLDRMVSQYIALYERLVEAS
jgi:glycosyltransferase involved in cell wall biosynthesis